MTATALLAELRAAGLTVTEADGQLIVRPAKRLTDAQRAALKANRDAVLAELAQEAGDRTMREDMARPFGQCPGVRWLLDTSDQAHTSVGSAADPANRGGSNVPTRSAGSNAGGLYQT